MEPTLPDLLLSGGKLMLIGMGIVYLFLALLVWIIGITAKLLRRYNPEPETLPARAGAGDRFRPQRSGRGGCHRGGHPSPPEPLSRPARIPIKT